VAATRAKDTATFTWYGAYDKEKQEGGPSRFLSHFGLLTANTTSVAVGSAAG